MRITCCRGINEITFVPTLYFYKDAKEFSRISLELLYDLTFISPDGSPFKGPEFTAKEAYQEILCLLKNELNDPTLEEELEEVLKNLKNSDTNTK